MELLLLIPIVAVVIAMPVILVRRFYLHTTERDEQEAELPSSAPRAVDRSARSARGIGRIAIVMIAALGIAGFLVTEPLIHGTFRFVAGVWPFAGALVLGMLVAGYFGLRQRPMAATALVELLIFAPFSAPFFIGWLMLANEYLDRGEPTVFATRLLSANMDVGLQKQRSGSITFIEYRLRFAPVKGLERNEFHVSGRSFERASRWEGIDWRISIKPGLFDQPWVEYMLPAHITRRRES